MENKVYFYNINDVLIDLLSENLQIKNSKRFNSIEISNELICNQLFKDCITFNAGDIILIQLAEFKNTSWFYNTTDNITNKFIDKDFGIDNLYNQKFLKVYEFMYPSYVFAIYNFLKKIEELKHIKFGIYLTEPFYHKNSFFFDSIINDNVFIKNDERILSWNETTIDSCNNKIYKYITDELI